MGTFREELVRTHFDAYSDLEWVKDLEPKFRAYHLDVEELRHYREAWNVHTEKRDWEWWQEHAKDWSNEKLLAETNECRQEIKTIEKSRSGRDRGDVARQIFRKLLEAIVPEAPEKHSPIQMKTKER